MLNKAHELGKRHRRSGVIMMGDFNANCKASGVTLEGGAPGYFRNGAPCS